MNRKEQRFVATVRRYYEAHGRDELPWRKTSDPYSITVSEIMLQQTQVERVVPKYKAFLESFPTVEALAAAPLASVLQLWQGLGYNRRAKFLHQCAKAVVSEWGGTFPTTYQELQSLPGVGPYTAGAVMAFAYNEAVPILETNIRTAVVYHFYPDEAAVSEVELLHCVTKTIDATNPREWYWALMDYGAHLKRTVGNLNKQTKAYSKQSRFVGSDRQLRGQIIELLRSAPYSPAELKKVLAAFKAEAIQVQLRALETEGLIEKKQRVYQLPTS